MPDFDVIVVGAGIAGLTAAMVAGQHGLRVAVVASGSPGGQVVNADGIENFPGMPAGVAGHELGTLLFEQAEAAGAQIVLDTVETLAANGGEFILHMATQGLRACAVIVAAGSTLRKLGIPGEDKFLGKGVSNCASCDGPLFKGRDVCVIGGGDTAFDEALVLARHASRVTIFCRGSINAQQYLQVRVAATPNIAIEGDTLVEGIIGESAVTAARIRNAKTNVFAERKMDGVFVAVGLDPATAFLRGVVTLDRAGHIETDITMRTSLPGVFAAGDIRKDSVRQVAAVAGDGATAAIAAYRYLKSRGC